MEIKHKYVLHIFFYHDKKKYEEHIYALFPSDPIREICKLAGLPMPQADS
jgi:tRNA 2-thiouridine synthesizing protein E